MAASACLAAWSGKAEKPLCNEEAIIAYGIYQCEVSTPEQLAGIAEMLDTLAEVPTVNLTLTDDLVFGADSKSVSEFEWKPIKKFAGVFNGNGHTIYGLNITASDSALGLFNFFNGTAERLTIANSRLCYKSDSSASHESFYAGLFAGRADATLKNIHNQTNTITYNDSLNNKKRREVYIGGIVGKLKGQIDSCSNSSNITAVFDWIWEAYLGGIVGYAYNASISNSSNVGNISNTGSVGKYGVFVGGIAGINGYGRTVLNCKNSGTISSTGYRVGGIVGEGSIFDFCENSGSITNNYLAQSSRDSSFVGGIAGTSGNIMNSTNTGHVDGEIAGGLAGNISAARKSINDGSVKGSLYAGGIGGVCSNYVVTSINKGSLEGGNVGGICGYSTAFIITSLSYTEKSIGLTTGGIVAINKGKIAGGFFDATKQPGIQPIAKDSANTINWEMQGLPTKDMQTIEFAGKLNDIEINRDAIANANFDALYTTSRLWTTTGSYPFFADSVNLPIQRIFLDDCLYVKTVYTDSKGHLTNAPLPLSEEGRYFEGWIDSTGAPVTKTTVFTDSQTVFAKYSSTFTDSSLVIFNDNPTEKTPVIGWNGEFEEPVLKMHKDSSLYQVISTPGEYAWYIKNTTYRIAGKNPYVDRVILANNIYLSKDTTKYLPESHLTGKLLENFVFDGDGHSIYGLNGRMFSSIHNGAVLRNVNLVNTFINVASAFADDNKGVIQNSSLRNTFIDSTAAELYGFVESNKEGAIIENCKNYSNFTEGTKRLQYIAGFVGYNAGTIKNVTNYGNISLPIDRNGIKFSSPQPASIAGIAFTNAGVIENAINKGNLYGDLASDEEQRMSIAGIAVNGGKIKNSRNEGNITFNYNKSKLNVLIGGISSGTASIDSSVNSGSIKVNIADSVAIKYILQVGGIGKEGSVKNSTNEGDITIIDFTSSRWSQAIFGGILVAGGTIDSCINKGNITGFGHVGGIIGEGGNGSIQNVRNLGKITAYSSPTYYTTEPGTHVGGIAGSSGDKNQISYAFNEGAVTVVANENDTTTSYVGGVCGFSVWNDMNIVSNTASISASGKKSFAGGISGFARYNKMQNIYNWGEIKSDSAAGGIIGNKYIYHNYYENVYNAAPVKAAYVGPIEPFAYEFDRTFKDTTTSIFYDSIFVRDTADKVSMFYIDPINPRGYNSKSFTAIVAITPMNTESMKSDEFVNILNTSNNEKQNSGIWTRDGAYPVFNAVPTPVVASSSSQAISSSSSEPKSSSNIPTSSSSSVQDESSSSQKIDSSSSQAKSSSSAVSSSSLESTAKSSSSANSSSSQGKVFVLQSNKDFNFSLEVSGRTILLSNVQEYASYVLFDMQGKTVSAGALQKGYMQIAVPRAGTYLIRVGKKLQKVFVE